MVINVKYYLRRDVSQEAARFEIFDELGQLYCRAEGRRTTSGETLRLIRGERTLAKIRDLSLTVLDTCSIVTDTESVRLLMTLSKGTLTVRFRGISFYIRGDVLSGSYDILDADNTTVAVISKDYANGCTAITVYNSARELFCLAALVCIERVASGMTPVPQTV